MVMDLKEIAGCILLVGVSIIAGELFPTDDTIIHSWIPLALGAASMLSGVMKGMAGSAAANRRNQQAQQQYMQQEMQKAINNGKESFQAIQAEQAQAKRNRGIRKSAWGYQSEATKRLEQDTAFQQRQLSIGLTSAIASNTSSITALQGKRNVRMEMQNLFNGLSNVTQVEKNFSRQKSDIDGKFESMMNQTTNNAYLPNIQLSGQPPIAESTSMPIIGGIVQGAAGATGQIAGYYGQGGPSDEG